MSLSADFVNLVESTYPQDVFFSGGNMPEEVNDEKINKKHPMYQRGMDDAANFGYIPDFKDDEEKRHWEAGYKDGKVKRESSSGLYGQSQARHFVSLYEDKWSGDVKTKKHPPEGKFTQGAEAVAKWLKSSHDSLKSAVAALNFYRNRNKDNMSQDKHDQILGMLHTAFGA